MEIEGAIFTKVDVEPIKFIIKMCQEIGIVNEYGEMVAKLKDGMIVRRDNMFESEYMLYDQPFDVNYATLLMNLYEQTCKYRNLPQEIHNKTNGCFGDYRTAYKLELVRK